MPESISGGVDLSVQSWRLASASSEFTHFGVVPKTKKVRDSRISGDDRTAEKKKNDI
jgi:hypothetical protein